MKEAAAALRAWGKEWKAVWFPLIGAAYSWLKGGAPSVGSALRLLGQLFWAWPAAFWKAVWESAGPGLGACIALAPWAIWALAKAALWGAALSARVSPETPESLEWFLGARHFAQMLSEFARFTGSGTLAGQLRPWAWPFIGFAAALGIGVADESLPSDYKAVLIAIAFCFASLSMTVLVWWISLSPTLRMAAASRSPPDAVTGVSSMTTCRTLSA